MQANRRSARQIEAPVALTGDGRSRRPRSRDAKPPPRTLPVSKVLGGELFSLR
jgi:hypothetical protein